MAGSRTGWPRRGVFVVLTGALVIVVVELLLWGAAAIHARLGAADAVAGGVVCVGDSNVEGIGAGERQGWPEQLEGVLRSRGSAMPVANLGRSGLRLSLIYDRLERHLEERRAEGLAPPLAIVLMGGFNDATRKEVFLWRPRERAVAPASPLRSVRFLGLAWAYLTRGPARTEAQYFASLDPGELDLLGEEAALEARLFDAPAKDDRDHYYRLVHHYVRGHYDKAAAAFDGLLAAPAVFGVARRLRLPQRFYRWEFQMMNAPAAPPPLSADDAEHGSLAAVVATMSQVFAAAAAEDAAAIDAALAELPAKDGRPYLEAWARLWRGWWSWRQGTLDSDEVRRIVAESRDLYPRIALDHALALALLTVAPGEALGITGFTELRREATGHGVGSADGRRWLEAAVARRHDPEAPLPPWPPRIPFLGATWTGNLLADPDEAARRAHLERELAAFDRLAEAEGIPLVVADYLDERVGLANEVITAFAKKSGRPFVGLQARFTAELRGDDRDSLFAADGHHPNAAGYALVARAVADALARLPGFPTPQK